MKMVGYMRNTDYATPIENRMKNSFVFCVLIAILSSILLGEGYTKTIVRSVSINGAHSLNSFDLLRVIRTKPSSLFNKEYFDRRLV